MNILIQSPLFLFVVIFIFSTALTEIVRWSSQKLNFVSKPTKSRWNTRSVSLGGGIAINLSLLTGIFWANGLDTWGLSLSVSLIFLLGLFDDIWGAPPLTKLIIQTIAGTLITTFAYVIPLPSHTLGIAFTILWTVGVSNAVNLIDNMDGLSSGVVSIAALGLYFILAPYDPGHARIALILSASSLGFLIHNRHPAKIFMGDAGSLAMGFLLAILSTKVRFINEIPQTYAIFPALMILIVPIFDTFLVMVARRNANRPLMSGGRDHTSHRLVSLGLSEKRAVIFLYLFGIIGACSAILMLQNSLTTLIVAFVSLVSLLILFSIFLLEIAVYPVPETDPTFTDSRRNLYAPSLPLVALYLVEIAIDVCVISVVWTAAHVIRFHEHGLETFKVLSQVPLLPYVIIVKLIAASIMKLYRGLWRSITANDVYRVFKATVAGTIFLVAGLALFTRLRDLSRMLILIDGLLTFMALLGTRAAISAFRRWFRKLADTPYNAALLGSSSLNTAIERATAKEKSIAYRGVILPSPELEPEGEVLGSGESLERIVTDRNIDILYVASGKFDAAIKKLAAKGISIRPIRIEIG